MQRGHGGSLSEACRALEPCSRPTGRLAGPAGSTLILTTCSSRFDRRRALLAVFGGYHPLRTRTRPHAEPSPTSTVLFLLPCRNKEVSAEHSTDNQARSFRRRDDAGSFGSRRAVGLADKILAIHTGLCHVRPRGSVLPK